MLAKLQELDAEHAKAIADRKAEHVEQHRELLVALEEEIATTRTTPRGLANARLIAAAPAFAVIARQILRGAELVPCKMVCQCSYSSNIYDTTIIINASTTSHKSLFGKVLKQRQCCISNSFILLKNAI